MLEIFYGARKQVFFTFGPYVLILFYGANATIISLLFAVSALLSFFLSPVVGKIIDRFGYKIVMISDTLILVIVCFFYGFAHHIFPHDIAFIICCINYRTRDWWVEEIGCWRRRLLWRSGIGG